MMYGYEGGWGAGWVLMSVLMLVVVGAVIVSVFALIRSTRTHPAGPASAPAAGLSGSALQTLGERFARGEIDEVDYTTRRDLLLSR